MDYYSSYTPRRQVVPPPPPRKSHRWAVLFLCVVAVAIFWLFGGHALAGNFVKEVSATVFPGAPAKQKLDTSKLKSQLTTIMAQYPQLSVSVSIRDLQTGDLTTYGSTQSYVAASTAKLITAACFLHEVEQGSESLGEPMGSYTAGFQLQQMIQQSDNDSWSLLDDEIGLNNLAAYASSIGLGSYNVNDNTITSADMTLLLQKLYQGQLLNKTNTNLLLSYMQNTNNEDLLPPAMPTGATFYRKYGELNGDLHDVAIVNYQNRPLAVAIYTNGPDLSDYTQRTQLFKLLGDAIFTFYYGVA
jgi:beta-lactamase class A